MCKRIMFIMNGMRIYAILNGKDDSRHNGSSVAFRFVFVRYEQIASDAGKYTGFLGYYKVGNFPTQF